MTTHLPSVPSVVRRASFAAALLAAGSVAMAQRATILPVHQLGTTIATARDSIGGILQLFQLPDGRVVVNDNVRDRLLILDSSMATSIVVLDTVHTAKRLYPPGSGTPLRYHGDSILFADPVSHAFLVIDPAGNIVRDIAFPPGVVPRVGNGYGYGTRSDVRGDIMYWFRVGAPCGDPTTLDSVPLFHADLSVRAVDTVAYARLFKRPCPTPKMEMGMDVSGPPVPIFPRRDEWALMLDGTIAIVREHDYSIDWIDPDGTHRHTPPVATGWHRLVDSEKVAILDTVKAYYTAQADSEYDRVLKMPAYQSAPEDLRKQFTKESLLPEFLDPDKLPDYLHTFQNPVRADADGNLWIPEAVNAIVPAPPGALPPQMVFDVVNRQGVLTDRVQIPGGTSVAGFGPGVVYLTSREGTTVSLVRMKIR